MGWGEEGRAGEGVGMGVGVGYACGATCNIGTCTVNALKTLPPTSLKTPQPQK